MENKTITVSKNTRDFARQTKGRLTYDQHYAGLMNFYMKQKSIRTAPAPKPVTAVPVKNVKRAANKDVYSFNEAFKDIVASLNYLDKKIDAVSRSKPRAGAIASCNANRIMKIIPKIKRNLFTGLVNKERLDD